MLMIWTIDICHDGRNPIYKPMNPVKLTVRNLGHVPSFKNGKQLFLTSKRNREWMKCCQSSFVSQCISACRIEGRATSMEDLRHFWMLCLPSDDNWKVIPEIRVTCERVIEGEEGADILIEEI